MRNLEDFWGVFFDGFQPIKKHLTEDYHSLIFPYHASCTIPTTTKLFKLVPKPAPQKLSKLIGN
jgi:hypothetical protein